jgi:uncharacterized membrane protein YedE/YeeE
MAAYFIVFLLLPLGAIAIGAPQPALRLIALGMALGVVLHLFQFGFTRAFYSAIVAQKTAGLRAILLMLALSTVLFLPLLNENTTLQGFYRPLSLGLMVGSLVFGIGMFIAGSCTSGTLNRLGQLNRPALGVLAGLIFGATWAAHDYDFWQTLPAFEPIRLLDFGLPTALLLQLGAITLLYGALRHYEHKRHQKIESLLPQHPWLWAAILLSIGNLMTLLILGRPWSIATVFPYWGIHLNETISGPLEDWPFWAYASIMADQLDQSPWQEPVSLMAIGLIAGSLLMTVVHPTPQAQAKKPKHSTLRLSLFTYSKAVIGGVLMGYGALIAYGCNIGALFSGIASGSLHGWIWFAFSLLGFSLATLVTQRIKREI